ncbi:MAG: TonB-dependent receptor [Saprospiraceae bacterium]|nr:TonB-dependent receptor [Saprospiraceae bacterium]
MLNILRGVLFICLFAPFFASAQNGVIRGTLLDEGSGDPISFATLRLKGTDVGVNTDLDGIFAITGLDAGSYTLQVSYLGYDSLELTVTLKKGEILSKRILLKESSIQLATIDVSGAREASRTEVQVSKMMVTPKQIKSLPSTGGASDIAQYLPVLPGIVFTGDQGGQLYIRGGSPVQNKILLDGMTIYNPFHSIGLFSVFETEAVRNIDVMTGGFSAEYGGRVSAIVDITTREGNMKRFGGTVGVNPFQTNILLEGPLKKLKEDSPTSASFLITGKRGYLDQTSKFLYPNAGNDSIGLPFTYSDLYGKVTFMAGSASRISLFGFNFEDYVDYGNAAKLDWQNRGGGMRLSVVPGNSNAVIGAQISLTDYKIRLQQSDEKPRNSRVSAFNIALDFTFFGLNNEIKYGFDIHGFNTDFAFTNFLDNKIQQESFNTDIAGFFKYKQKWGNLIFEPSFRFIYYSSLNDVELEPRLGLKYSLTDAIRFKLAGGFYSQNLISSVNELDVVNLFVGFLSGPDEAFNKPGSAVPSDHRLQKAYHIISGVELDLSKQITINIEPYFKRFTQLVSLNRNKLVPSDPNYQAETGDAYGIDFSINYTVNSFTFWGTYSLAKVTRDDGEQVYPPIFDRRHNVNALITYAFGKEKSWESAIRWNFGSGFPFTLTQGFYTNYNLSDGINSDILTENGELGILYDGKRNAGRLPSYHRMDISLKKTWKFTKFSHLEAIASVTNLYNRNNIFFFDRVEYTRVDQLPTIPSIGLNLKF